ncbi:tail fiber domain-containing protein [bacterium]|nr:tail fiber domain-containing protein [bacterium]
MKIFDPKLTGSIEILNEITGDVTMSANLLVEGNLSGNITGSASTASYIELSNVDGSASLASRIFDNSSSIASLEAVSGSYANSSSFASDISTNSASIASLETISGSYANSSSFASDISANSSSIGSLNAVSSSYLLNTTDTLTGDLTVTGNIIATTLNVQDVTASVIYSSGSNIFGSSSIDTQQFTGSILTSGSIEVNGDKFTVSGATGNTVVGGTLNSGAITSTGNATFAGDIMPSAENLYNIGSTATRWEDIWADQVYGRSVYIDEYIYHNGDTNTNIRFQSDRQTYLAGGSEFIDFKETAQNYITLGNGNDTDSRIQGGAGFIFIQGSNGYIGINDATPSYPLEINANTYIGATLETSGNATFAGMITVNGGGIDIDNNDDIRIRFDNASVFKAGLQVATTAGDMIGDSVINDFAIRSQENMLFATGGNTERMRITSAGNVGIGTAGYAQKRLDVSGPTGAQVLITGDSDDVGTTAGIMFRSEASEENGLARVKGGIFFERIAGSFGNGKLKFAVNGSVNNDTVAVTDVAMTIDNNKNVGIGTTSPDFQLDIENTSGAAVMRLHAAANNSASLRLKNDAVDWDVNCQTNDKFAIYNHTDGTERLVILPTSGNVGIGTNSPLTTLHVNQANDAQILVQGANKMALHQDAAWNSNILLGCYYDGSNVVYGTTNRGAFKIVGLHDSTSQPQTLSIYGASGAAAAGSTVTFNSVGFSQDEDGNVGIGTTVPNNNLTVAGNLLVSTTVLDGQEDRFKVGVGGAGDGATVTVYNASETATITMAGATGNITIAGSLTAGTGNSAFAGNLYITKTTPQLILEGRGSGNSGAAVQFLGWANSNANWQLGNAIAGAGFQIRASATVGGVDFATVATIAASTGVYTATSDINRKKDFENSEIGLKEVMELHPKLFRMKTESTDTDKHLGFIAQEVKEVIPQAYVEQGEDNDKIIGLSQMPIIAALTKAIQELKAEIEILKNK